MKEISENTDEFLDNLEVICEKHNVLRDIVCLKCNELICSRCMLSHRKEKKHIMEMVEMEELIHKKIEDIKGIMAEINKNDDILIKSLQISTKMKGKILDKSNLNAIREKAILAINKMVEEEYSKRAGMIMAIAKHEGVLSNQRAQNMGFTYICKNKLNKLNEGNREYYAKFILNLLINKKDDKKDITEKIKKQIIAPTSIPLSIQNSSNITNKIESIIYDLSSKIKLDSEKLIQKVSGEIYELSSAQNSMQQTENKFPKRENNSISIEEFKHQFEELVKKLEKIYENTKFVDKNQTDKVPAILEEELRKINQIFKVQDKIEFVPNKRQKIKCTGSCGISYTIDHVEKCFICNSFVCTKCAKTCEKCKKKSCAKCQDKCKRCHSIYCKHCLKCCERCHHNLCNECQEYCKTCGCLVCKECLLSCKNCTEKPCKECIIHSKVLQCNICIKCVNTCISNNQVSNKTQYNQCPRCQNNVCIKCFAKCEICDTKKCMNCMDQCSGCECIACMECLKFCESCEEPLCAKCISNFNFLEFLMIKLFTKILTIVIKIIYKWLKRFTLRNNFN